MSCCSVSYVLRPYQLSSGMGQWFQDTSNYEVFKQKVLSRGLEGLSPPDRQLVLFYAEKRGMVHLAAQDGDGLLIQVLAEHGICLNLYDTERKFPLDYVEDPSLFLFLVRKGAKLSDAEVNPLIQVIKNRWNNILPEVFQEATPEELAMLDRVGLGYLFRHNNNLPGLLLKANDVLEKHPDLALKIAINLLFVAKLDYLKGLLILVGKQKLKIEFLMEILVDSEFLNFHSKDHAFFVELNKMLGRDDLSPIHLILSGLMKASDVFQATKLLIALDGFDLDTIPAEAKRQVVERVESLQDQEGYSVWETAANSCFTKQAGCFYVLKNFGFNPNWCHPITRQTFLYQSISSLMGVELLEIQLTHRDCFRHNALEHCCIYFPESSNIRTLTRLGFRLSDDFPDVGFCRALFPTDNFLQSLLGAVLLRPRRKFFNRSILSDEEYALFQQALSLRPELFFHLSKFEEKKQIEFDPHPTCEAILNAVETGLDIPVEKLIPPTMTKEEVKAFNLHLFHHPEMMKKWVDRYMRLKEIVFDVNGLGRMDTTAARTVGLFIDRMGRLNPLELPENLKQAFEANVIAEPVEELWVEDTVPLKVVGRRIVIGNIGFKFLKVNEQYGHFSQELSVTNWFNLFPDRFQSKFIKPRRVCAIQKLPSSFLKLGFKEPAIVLQDEVPETPGIFVYLQNAEEALYPEARERSIKDAVEMIGMGVQPDLAALFHDSETSRPYALLVDLMRWVMGLEGKWRINSVGSGRLEEAFESVRYSNMRQLGLTDLRDANLLFRDSKSLSSHFKDCSSFHQLNNDQIAFLMRLHALSSLMLVDMLLLIERRRTAEFLDYRDTPSMERLGKELAEGFIAIIANYSKKDRKACHAFAFGCGIDWTRAARQIAFWIDTTPNGYPSWIARGKVPEGLYNAKVFVKAFVNPRFDPINGTKTNGHPDIGLPNGPSGLEEFSRAAYLLYMAIILAEPNPN